jgi:hypothetical protein
MHKLQALFVKLLFMVAMLFGAQATYAGLFGWHTTVEAIEFTPSGLVPHSTAVSGPTFWSCETSRSLVVTNYNNLGYVITSAPHCTPTSFRIPQVIEWERIKWPWPGPVCLSCPLLTDDNLALIYPESVKQVIELMHRYDIDTYNQQLLQLQRKFDLEGFEEQMLQIELNQQLEAGKDAFLR